MKIIKPSFQILDNVDGNEILKKIERAGRICYKSEDRITDESAKKFVKNIISSGHESVIEHEKVSVLVICDRGVTHEIVRHRIGSYSQESTRYCNYGSEKFGEGIAFIKPMFFEEGSEEYNIWHSNCYMSEGYYFSLLKLGKTPQEARSVLPNSLKTEIVITYNLREWRHFFRLRCSNKAHPQMREIAQPMLDEFKKLIPVVFDDINY